MDTLPKPKNNAAMNATALSLPVTPVSDLVLADAMQGNSLAAISREMGRGAAIAWISEEVDAVNRLCGGGLDQPTVTMCAELILDRFKFRTANALRLAFRDGLNSGKIFGKLTYPLIAEWLTNHEEAIEHANFQKHQASK